VNPLAFAIARDTPFSGSCGTACRLQGHT